MPTQLTSARDEFARQVSEASRQVSEASSQLADARTEFANELAEARREFGIRVGEAREEFVVRLGETRSECRRLVGEANRNVARAENIVAYVGNRDERSRAPKSRFRDYLRPRKKEMKELTAVRNSAFFDREFYLDSNPDVRASGMDAALHYLSCGGREGRDQAPFSPSRNIWLDFPTSLRPA